MKIKTSYIIVYQVALKFDIGKISEALLSRIYSKIVVEIDCNKYSTDANEPDACHWSLRHPINPNTPKEASGTAPRRQWPSLGHLSASRDDRARHFLNMTSGINLAGRKSSDAPGFSRKGELKLKYFIFAWPLCGFARWYSPHLLYLKLSALRLKIGFGHVTGRAVFHIYCSGLYKYFFLWS